MGFVEGSRAQGVFPSALGIAAHRGSDKASWLPCIYKGCYINRKVVFRVQGSGLRV